MTKLPSKSTYKQTYMNVQPTDNGSSVLANQNARFAKGYVIIYPGTRQTSALAAVTKISIVLLRKVKLLSLWSAFNGGLPQTADILK